MSRDVVLSKPTTTKPTQEEIEKRRYDGWLFHRFEMETVIWIVGLILGLIGQSVVALGYLIQKMAQMSTLEKPKRTPRSRNTSDVLDDVGVGHAASGTWWFGLAVFLLGHLFCWVALGFAPQSVLACLQSWNMVVVMVLGPRMVNETVPKHALRYCGLITIGCIIVVACGPQEQQSIGDSLDYLLVDMEQWYWLGPIGGTVVLIAVTYMISIPPAFASIILSAVCAWYASTLAKVTAVLAVSAVFFGNSLEWGVLVVLAVFVFLAVLQIHFMNVALRHGDATLVIPLYESLSMIGNIVFGAIFWHEFYGIGVARLIGFIFGVVVIVAGLGLLTHGKQTCESEKLVGDLVDADALEDGSSS